MALSFKSAPYFDDFDPANNFYRVLFKPGYAVQARELNQLQSILQHQISSVGNHLFKKNAMVIPGGITLLTAVDIVSVTGVGDPSVLVGKTITNAANFDVSDDSSLDGYITAVVLGYRTSTDTEPAALYIKYFKTQTDGRAVFNQSEMLKTIDKTVITFYVDPTIGSTIGKVATISSGVFYTQELFVDCETQSTIIEVDNSTVTNRIIGLAVEESIVTSDNDSSLLDNATGTPNQYAPGADRYKVYLKLVSQPLSDVIDNDKFITMMVVENNVITYLNDRTQYAELMKTLARRTYDANGNFIVSGLNVSVNEASDEYVWANVGKGRCYLGGYEYNQISDRNLSIPKPRDEAHQTTINGVSKFANETIFFYVAGTSTKELPKAQSLVQILNADPSVVGATVIGYGVYRNLQYHFGGINSADVYKMFFDQISLNDGYTVSDIGGIRSITAPGVGQGAAVLHELGISGVIGTFTSGNVIQAASTTSMEGTLYTRLGDRLYLRKSSATKEIPVTDTIKSVTSGATATRTSSFVTNYTPDLNLLIDIDDYPLLTMNNATMQYSSINIQYFDNISGTVSSQTVSDGRYSEFSYQNYVAYVQDSGLERFVDLTGAITFNGDYTQYFINATTAGVTGKDLVVYATVDKTDVAHTSASTTSETINIRTPSKSWMPLKHQDVQSITKVVEGLIVDVVDITYTSPTITVNTSSDHSLVVGDVIVLSGIATNTNTTGAFGSGVNAIYTVATIVDSNTFTLTRAGLGTTVYISGGHVKLPANIDSPERNITSRFIFDRNQNAHISYTSLIKLRKGATAPVGQIAVKYNRYSYNTANTNYLNVDSYGDYTGTDLGYIGKIPDVIDRVNVRTRTRSCLDFRTRASNCFFKNIGLMTSGQNKLVLRDFNLSSFDNTLPTTSSLVGKYVVGPGITTAYTITAVNFNPATGNTELTLSGNATANSVGAYYVGLHTSDLVIAAPSLSGIVFQYPKHNSRMKYGYIRFKPMHIMVYIKRVEDVLTLDYEEVDSLSEVLTYRESEIKLPLMYIHLGAYTVDMSDVAVMKFDNPGYKMIDIHDIKSRIDRNEYYTSLALNRDISHELVSAGLEMSSTADRGLWNENFVDLASQDYSNDDFSCTIIDKTGVAPGIVTRVIDLELDTSLNSTTWTRTGSQLTLPYTETTALSNTRASKFNNLNPFNAITWSAGKLTLSPHVDNWVDMTVEPVTPVVNNITNVTNNTTTNVTQVNNTTNVTNVTQNVTNVTNNITNVTQNVTNVTNNITQVNNIVAPIVVTQPPTVVPPPPPVEIVTEINNLRKSWGPDSAGGNHSITFDWKTNLGRTGRVNTDYHLSTEVRTRGFDGVYANSLINKQYDLADVKSYLQAGTHFDQKPPNQW